MSGPTNGEMIRHGCECESWPKPCGYHEGFIDGYDEGKNCNCFIRPTEDGFRWTSFDRDLHGVEFDAALAARKRHNNQSAES